MADNRIDAKLIAEMMNSNVEDRRRKLYPVLPPTGAGTRELPNMPRTDLGRVLSQDLERTALASNGYVSPPQPTRPLTKDMTDAMMYALRPDLQQFKHIPPARVSLARLAAEMDEQERSLGVGKYADKPIPGQFPGNDYVTAPEEEEDLPPRPKYQIPGIED